MPGYIQDWPLLTHTIIDHAAIAHPEQEIVTRTVEGPIHRYTFKDLHGEAKKVAKALAAYGIKKGDRVATLGWNTYRHLETWYGIMGAGAVCHTLNPRLFPEQIIYIANHAEDRIIFTDLTFIPILEAIADKISSLETIVIMTDAEHMPNTGLSNVLCYDDWKAEFDTDFQWVKVDENDPSGLCYTSGTTGNPKGVVYTHRSNVIHTWIVNSGDALAMGSGDVIMPVVPMFHANAWGIAYCAPASGTKMVLPGMKMDGESIYELLTEEKVSVSAAVPTVWLMLLNYLEENDKFLPVLNRVMIGGAACPQMIIEKFQNTYDVEVFHAWGMTELSPVGSVGKLKGFMTAEWDDQAKIQIQLKQGRQPYGVEMKIVDGDGKELPRDGEAFGHLLVRGPAIAGKYFKDEGGDILDADGWFDTGDVATIDEHGFMQITDRAKDVIKSGGEWISSIEIENLAVGHPKVAEAAVIGVAHPKWDERPLLVLCLKSGESVTKDEILGYMEGKIAKWWMPDDVVVVDEIPHTATGKIQKRELRDRYKDYVLPTAAAAE